MVDGEDRSELTVDDVFEVLGNQRRRYVFHHLKRHAGRDVYLEELTDRVAAWEGGEPINSISQRKHNSVRTALRQSHLPMMDERGVIEYDREQQTITLAPAAANLDVYLEVVGRGDIPWSLYYLGLTILCGLLVVAAFVGLPPFAAIGELGVTGAFVATVGTSALVQRYVGYTEMRLGADHDPPDLIHQ